MQEDKLSDALYALGFRKLNTEDVRDAINLYNKELPINADFANGLMAQILKEKPSWQIGFLETLDLISVYLLNR